MRYNLSRGTVSGEIEGYFEFAQRIPLITQYLPHLGYAQTGEAFLRHIINTPWSNDLRPLFGEGGGFPQGVEPFLQPDDPQPAAHFEAAVFEGGVVAVA